MELPSSSAASAAEAIDFQKLYKEEKRRAREERRRRKQDGQTSAASLVADQGEKPKPTNKRQSSATRSAPAFPPWTFNTAALLTHPGGHSTSIPRLHRGGKHRLSPKGVFYVERYLAQHADFQDALWDWLMRLPVNRDLGSEASANGAWTVLPHAHRRVALFRRSCCAGGGGLFPPPLQVLVDCLIESKVFGSCDHPPNHILVNHYAATQGILPHTDGPRYAPRTATISLGRGCVLLNFRPSEDGHLQQRQHQHQVLLHGGGSLVVFEGEAYSDYRHSIAELEGHVEHAADHCWNAEPGTAVLREERISITIRHYYTDNDENTTRET